MCWAPIVSFSSRSGVWFLLRSVRGRSFKESRTTFDTRALRPGVSCFCAEASRYGGPKGRPRGGSARGLDEAKPHHGGTETRRKAKIGTQPRAAVPHEFLHCSQFCEIPRRGVFPDCAVGDPSAAQGGACQEGQECDVFWRWFCQDGRIPIVVSNYFAIDSGRRNWLQWVVFVSFHEI